MLTVRFPDGLSLTYRSAVKVSRTEHHFMLMNERDEWVAMVGTNCIVEASQPSDISNPNRNPSSMVRWVLSHLRDLPGYDLAQLKSALHNFNAAKRRWK